MNIGMNISGLTSWTPDWPFVDVMKKARTWEEPVHQAGTIDTDLFSMDRNGWITSLKDGQIAQTTIYTGSDGHYPVGIYTCTYLGKGTMVWGGAAKVVSESPGKTLLQVTNVGGGITLKITAIDPTDYLRDIRILMPGFEDAYRLQVFHPLFLERLKPFSTLRFKDWNKVDNAVPTTWDKRTTPEFYTQVGTQTGREVAFEHMIDLCNRLKKNMWVCVSHQVDDGYISSLAKLINDTLDPTLKVYVEYSNEGWNPAYQQYKTMEDRGLALQLAPATNANLAALHYYSWRAVQVFQLFRAVFSTDRLVCVLASQTSLWTLKQVATFQDAYKSADALAIAPYFHASNTMFTDGTITVNSTVDQIIVLAEQLVDTQIQKVRENVAVAQSLGKPLLAYEGGQSLLAPQHNPNKDALTALFIAANRDSRMYDLYKRYLQGWQDAGAGLFNAFNYVGLPSQWGMWGVLEYQDQPLEEAHKYRALAG